jgi:hypothetical protein
MADLATFLRPLRRCPKCRRQPAVRFSPAAIAALSLLNQDADVVSVVCQRCSERFTITAGAVRRTLLRT